MLYTTRTATCYAVTLTYFKDTHREKAPSNETPALTKSMNMSILVDAISDQLFIISS